MQKPIINITTTGLLLLLIAAALPAIAQFSGQGKVSFERKTNLKQQYMTEEGNDWIKSRINEMAPFSISEFTLVFSIDKSLYRFEKDVEVPGHNYSWGKAAKENEVYCDFEKGKVAAKKSIYEETYFIEDSLQAFEWKIEDEMRTIAGFHCRKALTRICDSVVVVAFYTDELMVSGGPEGFCGLPGMILGLAIPRLHTTWFATHVELLPQQVSQLKPGRKDNRVNRASFTTTLSNRFESWGKSGYRLLWWAAL